MTEDEESEGIFRRWVAEYYEIPLALVGELPKSVYIDMTEAVLDDMERRLAWDHSEIPWPECLVVGCPRHSEEES